MKKIMLILLAGAVTFAGFAAQAQSVSPTRMSRERTMLTNQIRTLKNALKSRTNKLQGDVDAIQTEVNNNTVKINNLTPSNNLCNSADKVLSYSNGWTCKKITVAAAESGTKSGKACDTKRFTFKQRFNITASKLQRKSATVTCRYTLSKSADKALRTATVKNITPNVCASLARDTRYRGFGAFSYTGATISGTAKAQCINGTWNVINKSSCGCAGSYIAKIDRNNEH